MPHPNRSKVRDWPVYLASFRVQHNLSQAGLADALQISKRTVEAWEAGRFEPPPYLRLALERVAEKLLAGKGAEVRI